MSIANIAPAMDPSTGVELKLSRLFSNDESFSNDQSLKQCVLRQLPTTDRGNEHQFIAIPQGSVAGHELQINAKPSDATPAL